MISSNNPEFDKQFGWDEDCGHDCRISGIRIIGPSDCLIHGPGAPHPPFMHFDPASWVLHA